jgi:hypothetical protein
MTVLVEAVFAETFVLDNRRRCFSGGVGELKRALSVTVSESRWEGDLCLNNQDHPSESVAQRSFVLHNPTEASTSKHRNVNGMMGAFG